MVAGIDVVLTGLMLICFDGQPNCPGPSGNNALVVRAEPDGSQPCGLSSMIKTTLELQFDRRDFLFDTTPWFDKHCSEDKATLPGSTQVTCKFVPNTGPLQDSLCVDLDGPKKQRLDSTLQSLPRLDEVDRRFKAISPERLTDAYYVPTVLHFPAGEIAAGPLWPPTDKSRKTRWLRSDGSAGGAFPRELSDRVKVTYKESRTLSISPCRAEPLIRLTRSNPVGTGTVTIRNAADALNGYEVGQYEDIAYLLWYYRLGTWDTSHGSCPDYQERRRPAVVLRCLREGATHCSYYGNGEAGTRYWPPMLFPCYYFCPPN